MFISAEVAKSLKGRCRNFRTESLWRKGSPCCHRIMPWGLCTKHSGRKGIVALHCRWPARTGKGACLQPTIYTAPSWIPGWGLIMVSSWENKFASWKAWTGGLTGAPSLPTSNQIPWHQGQPPSQWLCGGLPPPLLPLPHEFYRQPQGGRETEGLSF